MNINIYPCYVVACSVLFSVAHAQDSKEVKLEEWLMRLSLARNYLVQENLELTDEQANELSTLHFEVRKYVMESSIRWRDATESEKPKLTEEINKEVATRIEAVLLPHQIKRIDQLRLQQVANVNRDSLKGLLSAQITKRLELTPDQKKR